MTDTLKPCPMCNELPNVIIVEPHTHTFCNMPDYDGGAFIECACGLALAGENEASTIKDWNTRADTPEMEALKAENERLNEVIAKAANALAFGNHDKDVDVVWYDKFTTLWDFLTTNVSYEGPHNIPLPLNDDPLGDLKAENAKLREALEEIVAYTNEALETCDAYSEGEFSSINGKASKALEGDK